MQVKKQQLEPGMEERTGAKLCKYDKAVYCHPADSAGKNTGVDGRALLQGISPAQGPNPVSCVSCTGGRFFATSTSSW